nr:unnamed protein product [Digitaria exilis]
MMNLMMTPTGTKPPCRGFVECAAPCRCRRESPPDPRGGDRDRAPPPARTRPQRSRVWCQDRRFGGDDSSTTGGGLVHPERAPGHQVRAAPT